MKIAIFHNFLDNIGGAEKATLILARELNADIYTTIVDEEKIKKIGIKASIKTIGWIPKNPPLRQQITEMRFNALRLKEKYDFYIISGDWALSAARHHKPNLWIVYSPTRELWDLYEHSREKYVRWYCRYLFDVWVIWHRRLMIKNIKHVTHIISTSKNVQKRVLKYLNKKSDIIYPPVDTREFYNKPPQDYWLSVNRLIPHKRVEVQIKAFAELPEERLIIFLCF